MLNPDWSELLESLNANRVRYLIVGGIAVAFHGHPRYTKDLDIWVEPSPRNAQRVLKALFQFGFGSLGLKEQDLLGPGQVIQLGYPPNRVDLLTTLEGVRFDVCYRARVRAVIDGTRVNLIDLANLKKNKRAVGRHQDLADLENLE